MFQGDNAVFHFELDDPSNTFAVVSNGRQGEIQLMNPVDREVKEIYVFQVSAVESRTSQQFRSQPSQVLVRVLDKNDNSPVFQKDSYEFDVPRTALRGFQIGQVIATDQDIGLNGLVSYFLQPVPAWDAFTVDKDSGVLSLDRDLALADVGTHVTTVVASDRTALASEIR
ncbi:protocadherin fat 4-like isoform x5 [Plakobranchus ocellatus]|uniref:Protocadherin fat 4-like isoform x5 n=1 Tax=Plakobranchus ocellatus TaxID=259542 RepID=A0AAV4CK94_9GAST|nr:protocadherin fat 4-like isoform x5 [Plakobranchus ocellatus]